jgi:polyribonucleotide nucleotidyltransferase
MGDMDFKVAGTETGMTAWQLDLKLTGLSMDIIEKAMHQAIDGRKEILSIMNRTMSTPRSEMSRYAPRMTKITIDKEKIGTVIGPGGKTIRAIQDETGTSLDIGDDGTITIGSSDPEAADKAVAMVKSLTAEVEVGTVYTGKVTRLMNFGAFVEILPGKEGLVHISELADHRVGSVEDVVNVNDEITVVVTEIDRMGRINLSKRAVQDRLSQVGDGSGGDGAGQPRPREPRRDRPPPRRQGGPPNRGQSRPNRGDQGQRDRRR